MSEVRRSLTILSSYIRYGGIQLGPDRFRIINQTARDALVSGGFANDAGKEKKRRGK